MTNRVVVVDDFLPLETLRAALDGEVTVEHGRHVPAGAGIVGLLVAPEAGQIDPSVLDELPDLRVLGATSAGTDHLPIEAARARGIEIGRPTDYCTDEVADHALALTIGLLRATHRFDRAVHRGEWDAVAGQPRRIAGTVLGLVGYGRIAAAFAGRAEALGMTVIVWDRSEPIDQFLHRCDVVSLHVPLKPETAGLIGEREFAAMKRGSFLVNVARGPIVDHAALGAALRSGHLAGAAVDVLPQEPPDADDDVLAFPNLVITPHAGWYSPEVATTLAHECARYLNPILKEL